MTSSKAPCRPICCTTLLVFILLAQVCCLSVMGLDYSYGENTPGTNNRVMNGGSVLRNVAATAAGTVPIPPEHKMPDTGTTLAGAAIDCGAIITRLSAMYRAITNTSSIHDQNGRDTMARPVIGVAVIDYGTNGLHAYLARSGIGLGAGAADDAERLAAAGAGVAALNNPNQWKLFSKVAANHSVIQAHRDGHMVALPHVGSNNETADIAAWVPAGSQPEGIHFAMGQTQIVKKWPNGKGGWFTDTSSPPNFAGSCALQKLNGNLYGYNGPLPPFPSGGARPFLSPNAHHATSAPKLVCAAEAAHVFAISVRNWAGARVAYNVGDEVASCVACQSYTPMVITQTPGSCTITAPAHGTLGTCPASLHHTGSCQVHCLTGYQLTGAATTCTLGVATLQTCQPHPTSPTHTRTISSHRFVASRTASAERRSQMALEPTL